MVAEIPPPSLARALDERWTVFIDRDGVINRRVVGDYVRRVDQLEILPGVLDAFRILANSAGLIIVITNQAGIGKGLMTDGDVAAINDHLVEDITRDGGRVDAVLVCPHRPQDSCACRKPSLGLIDQARTRFPEIDLSRSVVIGDSSSDVELARCAGMPSVLICGTGGSGSRDDDPSLTADTLLDAVLLLGDR